MIVTSYLAIPLFSDLMIYRQDRVEDKKNASNQSIEGFDCAYGLLQHLSGCSHQAALHHWI